MTRKDKILAVLKSFEQNIAYDEGGITLACITRPLYERLAEVIIDHVFEQNGISQEEYEHALNHIGELEQEIKELREELRGREFQDKYRW